jgi:hypothetical protein
MILITPRHAAPVTYTPEDKPTRFSTWTDNWGRTTETSQMQIQTMANQLLIITQTKELTT